MYCAFFIFEFIIVFVFECILYKQFYKYMFRHNVSIKCTVKSY